MPPFQPPHFLLIHIPPRIPPAFPSPDLLLNHIPGRVPAFPSPDLLLNHIPGRVPAFPSPDLLLNPIPRSVSVKSINPAAQYPLPLIHFFSTLTILPLPHKSSFSYSCLIYL